MRGQANPWNRFRGTCCSYPELVTVSLTHSPGKQLMPSLEALHLQGHGCARRLGPCWVMATTSRPRVRRRPELGVPVGLSRGTAAVEDRPPPAGASDPLLRHAHPRPRSLFLPPPLGNGGFLLRRRRRFCVQNNALLLLTQVCPTHTQHGAPGLPSSKEAFTRNVSL